MKIRAVNLGGWFVLERWMNSKLFKEIPKQCNDETCFLKLKKNAEKVLQDHWKNWITMDDLTWIKQQGINLVRIPIPWWLFGNVGYVRSVEYLDEVLHSLERLHLHFMLDLHTAPGCQNGFDNGGIQHVLDWPTKQSYITTTISVLKKVMKRYDHLHYFHSIELLNEPHVSIDLNLLKQFYLDSYNALRTINKTRYIVMHDAFRMNEWEDFFQNNHFQNVIFDTHLYQCFDDSIKQYSLQQHVELAMKRKKQLARLSSYVPVFVGEWSLGLQMNDLIKEHYMENLKQYATSQLVSMRDCLGHAFWNYRVNSGYEAWHFRLLVEKEIINREEFLT
jgi:glucan 1,3-beta-glucosidase